MRRNDPGQNSDRDHANCERPMAAPPYIDLSRHDDMRPSLLLVRDLSLAITAVASNKLNTMIDWQTAVQQIGQRRTAGR